MSVIRFAPLLTSALLLPSPAAGATQIVKAQFLVEDTQTLRNLDIVGTQTGPLNVQEFRTRKGEGLVILDGFNSAQGELTGVTISFRSLQRSTVGSSIVRPNGEAEARLVTYVVNRSSVKIGDQLLDENLYDSGSSCEVLGGNLACALSGEKEKRFDFDLDISSIDPFNLEQIVVRLPFSLQTQFTLEVNGARVPILTTVNRQSWSGEVQITYSYEPLAVPPPPVPEPATWAMMLAGFGLAGAGIRRLKPAWASAAPGRAAT